MKIAIRLYAPEDFEPGDCSVCPFSYPEIHVNEEGMEWGDYCVLYQGPSNCPIEIEAEDMP